MTESHMASLSNDELLLATQELARRSCEVEADLLIHLLEIDERKLYLARTWPSMFAFCTRELGFSEGAAYNRIFVARAARRFPAVIDALRTGRVHLAGLRLLAPHLTNENQEELLGRAAGKTKEAIAELVASIAPWASPCTGVWRMAVPAMAPFAQDEWKVQFCASREFRDEILEAQDLMRHQIPDGDLSQIFRAAIQLLVTNMKKKRFAVGRKCGEQAPTAVDGDSRHVPDGIKRAVYERDGGRCAFVDERGKRCEETGSLEFDHIEGFARTHRHDVDGIRMLCRAHNQYVAEKMYGRAFMEAARGASLSQDKSSAPSEHGEGARAEDSSALPGRPGSRDPPA